MFIDYLLQLTWFMAALTLDARRGRASRPDVLCCFKMTEPAVEDTAFWRIVRARPLQ